MISTFKAVSVALAATLGLFAAAPALAEDEMGKPVPLSEEAFPSAPAPVADTAPPATPEQTVLPPSNDPRLAPAPEGPHTVTPPANTTHIVTPQAPAATPPPAATKPAAKHNLKPAKMSKEDLDLWAFTTVSALAPGKTLADFRALPNLANEAKDELRGSDDASAAASSGPFGYRFTTSDGLMIRVMDYGANAFVTSLRLSGGSRTLPNDLVLGASRAQVQAVLGLPTRGGQSYAVYEGKSDVIRVFYGEGGALNKLEIDRGD